MDFSGLSTLIPIFGFLFIFTVIYALLAKTKILGENKFIHIFVSFCVAIIFVVSANAIEYVRVITPWFATFLVSLLFILIIVGLIRGKIEDFFKPWFVWVILVILIAIFVGSAVYVFADVINTYFSTQKQFFLQPQIFGAVILIILAIITSWIITRSKS